MLITIHLVARLFRMPVLRIDGDVRLTERAATRRFRVTNNLGRTQPIDPHVEHERPPGLRLAEAESVLAEIESRRHRRAP
ncbi:MAG: hypothetical protein ACR2K3_08080 [Nocardioides sp.]